MDWFRHDLWQALRTLWRRPGFSLLAVLTLALGLGVNTVAFSAVNALLFKPLRFANADRTGWLFIAPAAAPLASSPVGVIDALEQHATTLDAVAAEGRMPLAWDADGATEQVWSLLVSRQYFSLLTPTPVTGRLLGPADGTHGDVPVVVSERFWRRRLGAKPDVSDITLVLNRRQAFVVGVMPDGFQGPGGVFEPEIWAPLAARHTLELAERYEAPDVAWLTLFARPKAGVPAAAVEREAAAIAASALPPASDPADALHARYVRFIDGHPETRGLASAAAVGMAAVGIVLLIACFNVAGLVLARAVERRRDVGLRAALGASRWRIARQQLTESLVVATAGALAALLFALWSEAILGVFSLPAPIPQRLHFIYDWRALAFTAALALVATVLPALTPVLQTSRGDLARSLGTTGAAQSGGLGHRRTRRAFVVLQVAGSTCFLTIALLFGLHFVAEWRQATGFDADRLGVMVIDPSRYGYSPERTQELAEGVVEKVRRSPGVESAAVADRVSFYVGVTALKPISLDGRDCSVTDCPRAGLYTTDSAFFETMGIPIVAGRVFDARGSADRDMVVVSATAAAAFWPGESPLGRTLRVSADARVLTVVGVAADVVHRSMTELPRPYIYRPLTHDDYRAALTVVARGTTGSDPAVSALGSSIHALAPRLPPDALQSMRDRMAIPLWVPRTTAGFFGACGIAAVLLSTIGLFGVTYFAVSQRRREFGVRFALGASPADVRRMVLGEGVRLAGPGILAGAALSVVAGYAARSVLQGLTTTSALPYVAAIALQGAIAILASWSPAARASRSNPLDVLRSE